MRQEVAAGFDREEPMKYTGHERDFVGGTLADTAVTLDYMHARFFEAAMGRFFSVDPVIGSLSRPQSWNRYAYSRDNPTNPPDPTRNVQIGPGLLHELPR